MIFKNARIFRITKELNLDNEQLESSLQEFEFQPCSSHQFSSFGWAPPLGKHSEMLSHPVDGRILLCACKEERLLPASVLREQVEQEVEAIESTQARRVFPSEKRRLKEDAVQRLLPQAFTKQKRIYGYIDIKLSLIVIEVSTAKLAEEFTQLLRKSLGSLPLVPVMTQSSPVTVMTHWLQKDSVDDAFTTGDDCLLKDLSDTKVSLKTKGVDIHSPDFRVYLDGGMGVMKLALSWRGKVQFTLNDDLSLSRIRLDDLLRESLDDLDKDDVIGRMDADFAIMGGTFEALLTELFDSLGGIDTSIT